MHKTNVVNSSTTMSILFRVPLEVPIDGAQSRLHALLGADALKYPPRCSDLLNTAL